MVFCLPEPMPKRTGKIFPEPDATDVTANKGTKGKTTNSRNYQTILRERLCEIEVRKPNDLTTVPNRSDQA